MRAGIYSIFDNVANEYGPVFLAKSDPVAIRSYWIACKDIQADEQSLFDVGTFDTETGQIFPTIPPLHIVTKQGAK